MKHLMIIRGLRLQKSVPNLSLGLLRIKLRQNRSDQKTAGENKGVSRVKTG